MSAKRIASLLAAGTEIIHALDLGENLVAISHECDFPPEILDRPRVTRANISGDSPSKTIDEQVRALTAAGRPLYELDLDRLASLAPDLIVTQSQCEVCAVSLETVVEAVRSDIRLSNTKIVSLNPTTLDGVFEDILRVGEAADCPETASRYVDSLRGRVETVRQRTASLPTDEKPRVVCIEWIDPLMVAANWMPDLIELAGGLCGLTQAGRQSACTTWQSVLDYDPEVIVVMPCGFDLARTQQEATQLHSLPDWPKLSAVQRGRVYAVDGNAYFNRSGPRLVDSLELLAGMLHPGRFSLAGSAAYAMLTCRGD